MLVNFNPYITNYNRTNNQRTPFTSKIDKMIKAGKVIGNEIIDENDAYHLSLKLGNLFKLSEYDNRATIEARKALAETKKDFTLAAYLEQILQKEPAN